MHFPRAYTSQGKVTVVLEVIIGNFKDVSGKYDTCKNNTIPSDSNEFVITTVQTKIDQILNH